MTEDFDIYNFRFLKGMLVVVTDNIRDANFQGDREKAEMLRGRRTKLKQELRRLRKKCSGDKI